MKLYIHIYLPNAHKSAPTTIIHDTPNDQTFSQLYNEIHKIFSEINPSYIRAYQNLSGKQLQKCENMYISSFYNENEDVYLYCDLPRPVKVVEQQDTSNIQYTTIEKYTFYEYDENRVRVVLELPEVGKIGKDNIQARFFQRSFEIKIHNYKGKNLRFGSGKTQCKIDPDQSRFMLKDNKIIISIRKFQKTDNWFSLHKTKTIGGDSD
ncbi:HSP20-like chaperone [Pseudocohnilembus persalinus]|uniref:HSP20-like chaperone n=1 Tax=Pseudocohnilembus persalinus TaxID=266149 RepID=A0A0V0Q9I3_PSEPJ|nr:HSP20-like chaperone [Pseudocohnilembus persalinus]|eukprot:KRW98883.1 HSP20-like chaperone [Pseudocohnilembus persalinus]